MSLERKKRGEDIVILLFLESICYLSVFLSSSIFPRSSNRVHNHRETASLHCRLVHSDFSRTIFSIGAFSPTLALGLHRPTRGMEKNSVPCSFQFRIYTEKKKKKIINASLFRVPWNRPQRNNSRNLNISDLTMEKWN